MSTTHTTGKSTPSTPGSMPSTWVTTTSFSRWHKATPNASTEKLPGWAMFTKKGLKTTTSFSKQLILTQSFLTLPARSSNPSESPLFRISESFVIMGAPSPCHLLLVAMISPILPTHPPPIGLAKHHLHGKLLMVRFGATTMSQFTASSTLPQPSLRLTTRYSVPTAKHSQ